MKRYNVELPKYRLQLNLKLVRRRKPLLDEPIIPSASIVKRKYRTGSFLGRLARYFADHKNIRKIFTGAFTTIVIVTALIPQSGAIQTQAAENIVIESGTTLTTEKGMIYPVGRIKINQGYNIFHRAIDLGGNVGTPIKAVMAGIVSYSGWDRTGYGNLVVLAHQNGIESYYAHLSKIEVVTGQKVDINTEIGKMGSTGHATGVHLHLEIYQNGVAINPLTVLSQ
jgi:murein DD-endopeptidase MepM/ murein hydrolase activator NlpD